MFSLFYYNFKLMKKFQNIILECQAKTQLTVTNTTNLKSTHLQIVLFAVFVFIPRPESKNMDLDMNYDACRL